VTRNTDKREAASGLVVLAPFVQLMVSISRRERPDGPSEARVDLQAGGQGAWIARMSALLGAETVICCPLGGRSGRLIGRILTDDGLEVDARRTHRSSPVWISDGQEGDDASIAETPPPPLDRHEADDLCNLTLARGLASRVVALAGVPHESILGPNDYERLVRSLRTNGVRVVADVSGDLLRPVANAGADLIKVGHEELQMAGLSDGPERRDLIGGAARLLAMGAATVLVSRAELPALVVGAGGPIELRVPPVSPANPPGAGDSMTGALAARLAAGADLPTALRTAAAAGSLNALRRGLGTGTRSAIELLAPQIEPVPLEGADG